MGVEVALRLDILVLPAGIEAELIQIIHQIAGIVAGFVQVGDPRLDGEANPDHRPLLHGGPGNASSWQQEKYCQQEQQHTL